MRIGLVAPSAVPFTVGGAEKLWWGLTTYVNRHTPHAMELVKLPSPERNLWEIVRSYRQFASLDLDHFDLLISTKYPAWMVRHGNHVVYLQHRLRGLYDTYPEHLPLHPNRMPRSLQPLWDRLQNPRLTHAELPEVFERLEAFRTSRDVADDIREELIAFPGPFARAVVHALDRVGLAPSAIRRYFAISKAVTLREDYFPPDADVEVVPHPSDLEGFRREAGEFVFTASRLDGPKRLDLLIRAYRQCRTDAPLLIAGEGPAGETLRALAEGEPRIRFTGRLTDDELVSHYARAHFVVFVPLQEDMGLITLEAMKSGKPVLTVSDAGGVTEFVRDGVNGRIVPPDPGALARAIDAMMADRDRLEAMGRAAHSTGEAVSWRRTVDALLGAPDSAAPSAGGPAREGNAPATPVPPPRARPRILSLNSFDVFPPSSGGKKRIFYLFEALSRHADITLLNLATVGSAPQSREFSTSFREIRIPPSERFLKAEAALQRALRKPVTDIAALLHAGDIPLLESAFKELAASADVVVASHVYMAPFIARHWSGEVWYDAHNVEADMKADILGVERLAAPLVGPNRGADAREAVALTPEAIVARVAAAECALVRAATRVLAVSVHDAERFAALYGRDLASIEQAPNGVSLPDDPWLEAGRRAGLKASLGFDAQPVALFVGADHGPNHDAADLVVDAARHLTGWSFWIAGSICDYAGLRSAPANVFRLGVVTEAELAALLRGTDVGLNPMLRGSGTNLKMLDYAAHGALVLSTEIGARGLGFVADTHYIACPPDGLAQSLDALARELPSPRLAMRSAARRLVEERFSWRTIADRIAAVSRDR